MRRHARGQTLLLFALTLVLIAVLVLMTLGIGVRIHERQEQQVVADAAAYSQAVVTARTYNALSSMNRVIIAQMASIAAAQALLSWGGYYHGTLNQARDTLAEMAANASCPAVLTAARDRIMDEDRRLIDIWEAPGPYGGVNGYDLEAGSYIRQDLYETALLIADHQRELYREMMLQLDPGTEAGIADAIAFQARQGSPWRSERRELWAGVQSVTSRELGAAVDPLQTRPRDMLHAVMATRGVEWFTSAREATWINGDEEEGPSYVAMSGAEYVARRINRVIQPTPLEVRVQGFGTAYFGSTGPFKSSGPGELEGYDGQPVNRPVWERYLTELNSIGEGYVPVGAWAQDVGTFRFDWPDPPDGCTVPEPTEDSFGYIVSTHPEDTRDDHMWRRGNRGFGDYREWNDELGHVARSDWPDRRHTFVHDPGVGIGIWPVFVDYRAERLRETGDEGLREAETNLHGQPKTMVNMRRNYAVRNPRDPWELRFRLGLSGEGELLDLRTRRAGFDESIAVASGLTYYHRGAQAGGDAAGHAREPPNFLNPFWRATLVASDADEPYARRGADVIRTLEEFGLNQQAGALRQLRARGFEGIP